MAHRITIDGDRLLVDLVGRIDVISAPELEADLNKEIEHVSEITFDLSQLGYISSAGLRVLLATYKRMQRMGGEMEVINVEGDVLEVMRDTGFADILSID
jgi:anti-sigma B factor antagonist